MSINPMQSAHDAPRCKVKSKRTGLPCRSPAVNGYQVCGMHGAGGGAPEGKRNGNFRHGGRTKDANDASRYVNELVRLVRGTDYDVRWPPTAWGLLLTFGLYSAIRRGNVSRTATVPMHANDRNY